MPNLPEPRLQPQSVKAEKLNPRLAPVGIKQVTASQPTTRFHVSGANSQSASGHDRAELFASLIGLIFKTFSVIPQKGEKCFLC